MLNDRVDISELFLKRPLNTYEISVLFILVFPHFEEYCYVFPEGVPVAQWVKHWPADLADPESSET